MNNNQGMVSCAVGCWLVAALGGALAAALLMLLGDWTFLQAAFIGAVVFAVAGALLSWLLCKPLPPMGAAKPAPAPDATKTAASAPVAKAPAAASAPAPTAAAAPATLEIKPSTPLAGEAELAERKGEWKYEGGAKPAPAPEPAPKPEPKPEPKPAPAAADPGPGTKPETLAAAREGGPDNLKQIKGVGPKLEALLHSMGFYHFDQVASWGPDEVAWVDQNLEGFKGRVTRDEWVAQAKILAEGGTTEFSSKVKKGNVY
ncbi:MAG: hypothetical protein AAFQ19_07420 [Pseudomonadota bacterium]